MKVKQWWHQIQRYIFEQLNMISFFVFRNSSFRGDIFSLDWNFLPFLNMYFLHFIIHKRQSTTCTNLCYLLTKTTAVLRMNSIHTCLIISRFFKMYNNVHKLLLLRWCISWYWSHLYCIVPGEQCSVGVVLWCTVSVWSVDCGVWIHYIGITSVGCLPAPHYL